MSQTSRPIRLVLTLASVAVLAVAVPLWNKPRHPLRPNIVLFITDDQTPESMPHDPPVMPYLQDRMEDPKDHWITFVNAFISTPLCCPSRATILTGRYAHETGVVNNGLGNVFDDSQTIATWLHAAGYYTGLFGKYLNLYPFGRGPFVPPGWDRWGAKVQPVPGHAYYDTTIVLDGQPVHYASAPRDYSTDVEAGLAEDFIRTAPGDRPFFLLFAPPGPHKPWIPAPRDIGSYPQLPPQPPAVNEADVSDKPAWIRNLPPLSPSQLATLQEERRLEYETLRSEDDAMRRLVEALRRSGELGNTVIIFLTDNGYSFGEHRWVTKSCPYDECIHTPFLVRYPWQRREQVDGLVSNADIAPAIVDLAHARAPWMSGRSFLPLIDPVRWAPITRTPAELIEMPAGGSGVPHWYGLRTADFTYVEYPQTGERELYDLTGTLGPKDPYELDNRAGEPAYTAVEERLSRLLSGLLQR